MNDIYYKKKLECDGSLAVLNTAELFEGRSPVRLPKTTVPFLVPDTELTAPGQALSSQILLNE